MGANLGVPTPASGAGGTASQAGNNMFGGTSSSAATNGSLLPTNVANAFQGLGQTANEIGSASALAAPNAAQFQQNLFAPGLNQTQQSFLQNAGSLQEQQIEQTYANTMQNQYAGNPGIAGSQLQLGAQTAQTAGQNLLNTALPLYEQNQQLATGALGGVLANPITAAQDSAQAASSQTSLAQSIYDQPFQLSESILGGSPFIPPTTVVPPAQVSSSGGKK